MIKFFRMAACCRCGLPYVVVLLQPVRLYGCTAACCLLPAAGMAWQLAAAAAAGWMRRASRRAAEPAKQVVCKALRDR
jgi:hypothetical protein